MELNSELDRLRKYSVIEAELQRAKRKHPEYPDNVFKQVAIISEEAGEVAKVALQYHDEGGSLDNLRAELIQTAAMCMRMLEYLGISPEIPENRKG